MKNIIKCLGILFLLSCSDHDSGDFQTSFVNGGNKKIFTNYHEFKSEYSKLKWKKFPIEKDGFDIEIKKCKEKYDLFLDSFHKNSDSITLFKIDTTKMQNADITLGQLKIETSKGIKLRSDLIMIDSDWKVLEKLNWFGGDW